MSVGLNIRNFQKRNLWLREFKLYSFNPQDQTQIFYSRNKNICWCPKAKAL